MRLYYWGLAAALLLATLSGARANDCFALSDWSGWKADGDQALYLKVRIHDVYRVDLSEKESFLNAPGMHLVSKSYGSSMVCNPLDLDLRLADNVGPAFASHLFIKSITKLTPEQIEAIPEKSRP
jgi:hypothetical protein